MFEIFVKFRFSGKVCTCWLIVNLSIKVRNNMYMYPFVSFLLLFFGGSQNQSIRCTKPAFRSRDLRMLRPFKLDPDWPISLTACTLGNGRFRQESQDNWQILMCISPLTFFTARHAHVCGRVAMWTCAPYRLPVASRSCVWLIYGETSHGLRCHWLSVGKKVNLC